MKQSLQLKVSQNLAMTPQLQQAIKLLQLSSLELQAEIQQALDNNPLLEIEDDTAANNSNSSEVEKPPAEDKATKAESQTDPSPESSSEYETIPDELPVDTSWDAEYEPSFTSSNNSGEEYSDFSEYTSSGNDTLQDHLLEQVLLNPLSETDRYCAVTLIEAIDENGFLTLSKESLLQQVQAEYPDFDEDDFHCVINHLQHLDPVGAVSSGPAEAMSVQLQQLDKNTPFLDIALTLLNDHLEFLSNRDYARIKRTMKINDDVLHNALKLIQTLNPRPGSVIQSSKTEYIVPDVYVKKHKDHWTVSLNGESAPKLTVNDYYANLIKSNKGKETSNFLKGHMQEAKWFIKSLQSRNETLLKVATSIVEKQQDFMNHGEVKMKPLILKEIADELGFHESTISRVTNKKYMHTPRGVFEFKYFFSSHVSTNSGEACSATAIRAMIKKLIEEEPPNKPLSDNKIANILSEQGIKVARRTVAKYRESINIPPSNERKQI